MVSQMALVHRLCSKSPIKETALRVGLDVQHVVPMSDCLSGVSEQPFGREEIHQGARNRLKNVLSFPKWSIESGLIEENEKIYEISVVVLVTRFGTIHAWSRKHVVRRVDFEDYKASTYDTLGKFLVAAHPDKYDSHDNWYDRVSILSSTIRKLWHTAVREAQLYTPMTARVVDFKGVPFLDICDVLADPKQRQAFEDNMKTMIQSIGHVTHVVAVQSRGFFGAVAMANAIPRCTLVPARSEGKMPGELESTASYESEYAKRDPLYVQAGRIKPGDLVVIYDDILATFGTANALVDLIRRLGATVVRIVAPFAITTPDGTLIGKPKAPVSFVCTQHPGLDTQVITKPSQRLVDMGTYAMGSPRTNAWMRARYWACVPLCVKSFTFSKQPWFYGPADNNTGLRGKNIFYVVDTFHGGDEEILMRFWMW